MAGVTSSAGGRKRAAKAKAAPAATPASPATPAPVPAPAATPVQPKAHARPGLEIVGPKLGRRRAGRAFGAEPVRIPLDELTEDEIDALTSDPALTVVTVQIVGA